MMHLPKHLKDFAPRLAPAGRISCVLCNKAYNGTWIKVSDNPKRYAHKDCIANMELMWGRMDKG